MKIILKKLKRRTPDNNVYCKLNTSFFKNFKSSIFLLAVCLWSPEPQIRMSSALNFGRVWQPVVSLIFRMRNKFSSLENPSITSVRNWYKRQKKRFDRNLHFAFEIGRVWQPLGKMLVCYLTQFMCLKFSHHFNAIV